MASEEPEIGDKVSWQYSGSRPSGEVVEKKTEGELSIQSKKGNTIKKNASADNPALHMARPGNDVVKRQSEVEVEEKAAGGAAEDDGKKEENGTEAKPGDKHARDEEEAVPEGEADTKKAKTATPAKARGRPKKAEEKPKATPAKKPTAAEKKSAAAAEKKETAAEKKEAAAAAEKKDEAATAEPKKARGRPKKTEGEKKAAAPKKEKKTRTPATADGVGSRTRSKKT